MISLPKKDCAELISQDTFSMRPPNSVKNSFMEAAKATRTVLLLLSNVRKNVKVGSSRTAA